MDGIIRILVTQPNDCHLSTTMILKSKLSFHIFIKKWDPGVMCESIISLTRGHVASDIYLRFNLFYGFPLAALSWLITHHTYRDVYVAEPGWPLLLPSQPSILFSIFTDFFMINETKIFHGNSGRTHFLQENISHSFSFFHK